MGIKPELCIHLKHLPPLSRSPKMWCLSYVPVDYGALACQRVNKD